MNIYTVVYTYLYFTSMSITFIHFSPVMPSMAAVALSRFLARSEPLSTLLGMISEPTMARKPVSRKRSIHIAMILTEKAFKVNFKVNFLVNVLVNFKVNFCSNDGPRDRHLLP